MEMTSFSFCSGDLILEYIFKNLKYKSTIGEGFEKEDDEIKTWIWKTCSSFILYGKEVLIGLNFFFFYKL